jgi:lipoprotein-anchoring transpeptidase ErfK/SrfK
MMRVSGHRAAMANGRLWRTAILTAAAALCAASQAEAALYYWSDPDPGYYRPGPTYQHRPHKPRPHQAKKIEVPKKESAKPQGPLIIAISIEKQSLKIYDANGFFAATPISTGMKGHPTPMGVFSVIQKHKLHHSNIYSGAPMPFMQRITWSGVAMHAGVLPGYPASHGCIRMPMAFAVKMWNWTKMGARVVVTPGDIMPASFSHPLLATQKVMPQPAAASEPQPDTPPAAKADKAAAADVAINPAISEASLELRTTLGHDDSAKPVIEETPASAPSRERTQTADASDALPATNAPITMTDATPSGGSAPQREEPAVQTGNTPPVTGEAVKAGDAANADLKPEAAGTAISEAEPVTVKSGETVSSDDRPVETKPSENTTAEIKPAETGTIGEAGKKPDETKVTVEAGNDAAKTEASTTGSMKAEEKPAETKLEAKADDVKADQSKPDAPKTSEKANEKPDDTVKAVTAVGAPVADVNNDPARLPDMEKPAAPKPDPAAATSPKRTGQIAAFISRKDSKLYVRENFKPLFNAPVTIAPRDRPLGTHIFTVQVDKDDANVLHWSVVSLPVPAHHAERRDEDARASRRRKIAGAVEVKEMPVPDSPAEALDRLTVPADAMARITEALSTGASIIVSDQGIAAGETGEGTDFIVSLR